MAAAPCPALGVNEYGNCVGGQAAETAVPGVRGGVLQREQREQALAKGAKGVPGEHPRWLGVMPLSLALPRPARGRAR